MAKKFIILSSGYINGRRLAIGFEKLGIDFEIVTICYELPKKKPHQSLVKFGKDYLLSYIKSIYILRKFAQRKLPRFPKKVRYAGFCNGLKLKKILSELNPDYIFMMGGGILSNEIIRLAKIGVLNSHPGLLPWIRGVHVIENAILRNTPIGITCHFIDIGIDTGPIINRYVLPLAEKETLIDLIEKANLLECCAMLELAENILHNNPINKIIQEKKYKYCSKLKISDLENVNNKIEAGEPQFNLLNWSQILNENKIHDGNECINKYSNLILT
jgi:hypothetical protein